MVEKEGRLVLLAGDGSPYGVEISPVGAVAQARVVSFSGKADPEADRAEEARWCGKFAEFRERAGLAGSQVSVERALKPGETPVKQVGPMAARTDRTPVEAAKPAGRTRTL